MSFLKRLCRQMLRYVPILYRPTIVSRRSVLWAYRLLLDRNPESRAVVTDKLRGPASNMADLRRDLILSKEFAQKNPDLAPFPLGTEVWAPLACGRRLLVDLGDGGISGPIVRNDYEQDLVNALPALVKPGALVLDVGANIGFFTIHLAELVGEQGQVIAFEPIHELAALLTQSVADNHFQDRVSIHNKAVGAEPGQADILYVLDARNQGASYLLSDTAECQTAHEVRRVPVCTLDDHEFGKKVHLIKMDIEGAEPLCLQGAREVLERDRPIIITEIHPIQLQRVAKWTPEQYVALFDEMHYVPHTLVNGRLEHMEPSKQPITDVLTIIYLPQEHQPLS